MSRSPILHALYLILWTTMARADPRAGLSGVVRDSTGAVIVDANITLLNAHQATVGVTRSDAEGRFVFAQVPLGSYELIVVLEGFAERRIGVRLRRPVVERIEVALHPRPISEAITVTANPGMVESIESISQQVNVVTEEEIEERTKATVAQVANEEAGVHLQRTSPTVAGIFVRGLTGNKVNVFIDGVRFSNSAARGGINTFLNLIDPSDLQAVEILRGPNSAQYGSDAIGGSVQFLSRNPGFSAGGKRTHGRMSTFFNTADAGSGSSLTNSYSRERFALLANIAGRRINTLRTGHRIDSHNAVTRYFGLGSDLVINGRLPDTAFTEYGGMLKLNWSPAAGSQVSAGYMRRQQDGGKRYDQLLGGDGNLVADLRNLMLDFFYLKYHRVRLGALDGLTLAYSYNSQREERVNQAGNGNPLAPINHEYERTNVHGVQVYADKLLGTRQTLIFGGEFYRERMNSPSYGFDPGTMVSSPRRPRVPDNALYRSGGIFLQDVLEAIPGRLRLIGNLRYSAASYLARAADSPLVSGRHLWPDDSLSVGDLTFRAGLVLTAAPGFNFLLNISRGFRAPHLSDLDTLGLTGSGFEVTASEVAGLGATIGSTADRNAVSTGRPVVQVKSETSQNYEAGLRFYRNRIDTDFAFFVNNISDSITKQALIMPPGAVGRPLGDQLITAQTPNGAVFVAAATNPVLVRANFDDAHIFGFEHTFDLKVSAHWSLKTLFTYLHAQDRKKHLPPNIESGTPAPNGYFKIRYAPPKRRFWIEPYLHAAYKQDRLSSLDLEDRRTGATRSRASISNFFFGGATVRGLVGAGADGFHGTSDDVLFSTGEILAQIQNRVLGIGIDSAPLYRSIPGYITFNLRGGFRISERHSFLLDFENMGDRNYRGMSWGMDAPGRSLSVRYSTTF